MSPHGGSAPEAVGRLAGLQLPSTLIRGGDGAERRLGASEQKDSLSPRVWRRAEPRKLTRLDPLQHMLGHLPRRGELLVVTHGDRRREALEIR